MSDARLVRIEQWAASRFERAPTAATLRRWCRIGCISPAPRKIGRAWFVAPDAQWSPVTAAMPLQGLPRLRRVR